MHRQVPDKPLGPGTLPFREQGERPLDRSEDRQHAQKDLLAVDGAPPADPEDDKGNQHDDLVQTHDGTGRERSEPQFRGVLLHRRHLIHSGILHGGLDEVRVGRAGPRHICLRLQVLIKGVPYIYKSLHFLIAVADLRGLGLIQVMRIGSDGVRYVRQEIQHAPRVAAVSDAGVRRRIPPAQDDAHGQRTEELHHVQRLVLDHHLVGHTGRHDDREERSQRHAHLEDPPVTTNYFKRIKPSETMR